MGGLNQGIDRSIEELLRHRNTDYIGMDIRIRGGDVTSYVWTNEDSFPENTDEDEIARLKEKLELLKQIRRIQEILEKFIKEHPDFVPIKYPEPFNPPWHPYLYAPWITWEDDNMGTPLWKMYEVFCGDQQGPGDRFW